jgi:cellulose synthase/poly-beta-1,6-N-acetylglucosamine synthase-like glycosyltransferase
MWIFWGAATVVAYTFLGYAGWLWLRVRLRPRPTQQAAVTPSVSVVMVVRNEAAVLERKLENLLRLHYPEELREIIVVSDGSTDATPAILARYESAGKIKAIFLTQFSGKPAGLQESLLAARGEVVVFTDVRQMIEADALCLLMESFADSSVGCVSGELMLGDPESGESARGMGLYWRMEKKVREWESASGSVVGATGAFYAARRELIVPPPPETILDDVFIPMQIVRQGWRVGFDPRARAWDAPDLGGAREFARKVRTLGGNYQLLQLSPWLLSGKNPLRFEFISHKLLRLLAPFALAATLLTSAVLSGPVYRAALVLQLAFYGLSLLAMAHVRLGPIGRLSDAALTFVVLNTAAVVAFFRFVTGRKMAWS